MRRALARSCGAALATLGDVASASWGCSGWPAAVPHCLVWQSGVKTQANDLRVGAIFEDKEGRLLEVMRYEHTHGQGRASGFVTLEARDLRNGAKRTERLRPSDAVERVILDDTEYTFLFAEGSKVTVMHATTFEQVELPRSCLGDAAAFLADGVSVRVSSFGEEVLTASLPEFVEVEVTDSGPSMKNERTDGKQLKMAVLANGAAVQVPGYVKDGDVVVIRPSTGEFVRRKAKE